MSAASKTTVIPERRRGFWAIRGQPELYKFMLLAFTAGVVGLYLAYSILRCGRR